MKHLKKFNESRRDDLKDEISSSLTTHGNLKRHEQEIKNDILSYVDQLLDDEIDLIHQLYQLEKGEISVADVDMPKLMGMGQKLNQELMNIVKNYQ